MTSTPISAALAALRLAQLSAGRQDPFTGSAGANRQGSFTSSGESLFSVMRHPVFVHLCR